MLVGLMGSGKTTVGRALAAALGVPFADNDTRLERLGLTAAQLASARGVDELHAAEARVALDALRLRAAGVIALAASVIDDPAVRDALRSHDVVWLRARPSTLRAHLSGGPDHRPAAALLGEDVEEQDARRSAAYASVARTIVDVDDCTATEVVDAIRAARHLNATADPPPARGPETGSSPSSRDPRG